MRDKYPYRYLKDYENRRTGYYKQLRGPSERFVSSKFDFQSGNWAELNGVFIPSLNMTLGKSISALKKSWKMYRTNLSRGEPTDQLSLRLLKLQAGLGLEQTDWLKEGLLAMGYTPSEIEGGGELDAWETEEGDSERTDEERQLLAEEKLENDILGTSVSEESENQQTEWTDLDRMMYQEELEAEREVPW